MGGMLQVGSKRMRSPCTEWDGEVEDRVGGLQPGRSLADHNAATRSAEEAGGAGQQ